MGNLLVCGLPRALAREDVVKLVHSNGLVEEFYRTVRVGELSVDYPQHVICHSADLRRRNLRHLSEEDTMDLGQIYFLLPRKVFEFPLTQADVATLFSKAGVAREASYKELQMKVQDMVPPSAGGGATLSAVLHRSNMEPEVVKENQDVAVSRELIQKLLAETRSKLQSAMVAARPLECVVKEKDALIKSELQTAYTRHLLARSCTKLWRPPLETIEEGNFISLL